RIVADLWVDSGPGALTYEDRNYNGRSGWKEIVIRGGAGLEVKGAGSSASDRSAELTAYPQDPMFAPPHELKAALAWSASATATRTQTAAAPEAPAVPAA